MNTRDYTVHIDRVFRETSPEDISMFVASLALKNSYLGYVLLERFGKYETSNVRSLVQQCFFSPQSSRQNAHIDLDWNQIDRNLGAMVAEAERLFQQGDLNRAVDIARNVIILTYKEFRDDHPASNHEKVVVASDYHCVKALDLLHSILIDGEGDMPVDERRKIILAFTREIGSFQPKDRFCPLSQFLLDAKSLIQTANGYAGTLLRKIESLAEPDNHPFIVRLVRHYLDHAAMLSKAKAAAERENALAVVRRYPECHEAYQLLAEYMATVYADIPVASKYDTIFDQPLREWLSGDARGVPARLAFAATSILKLHEQGRSRDAVTRYLQLLRTFVLHFAALTPDDRQQVLLAAEGERRQPGRKPKRETRLHAILSDLHSALVTQLPLDDRALLDAGHAAIRRSAAYQQHHYPPYLDEE